MTTDSAVALRDALLSDPSRLGGSAAVAGLGMVAFLLGLSLLGQIERPWYKDSTSYAVFMLVVVGLILGGLALHLHSSAVRRQAQDANHLTELAATYLRDHEDLTVVTDGNPGRRNGFFDSVRDYHSWHGKAVTPAGDMIDVTISPVDKPGAPTPALPGVSVPKGSMDNPQVTVTRSDRK